MNDFSVSFWLGLFFTILLFILSFVLVLGIKSGYSALKKFFPEKPQTTPQQQPPNKKPSKPKPPQVVRTIEIDPNQVDKIYVKKAQ